MRQRFLFLAVAVQEASFLCGCGASEKDVPECRRVKDIISYVANEGNAISDTQIARQFTDALSSIQDRAVESRYLREYASAIQARLPRMRRVRGYLTGADPNFWLAMNCCDEMRKNGFQAADCLDVPFSVLKVVCDEIRLAETGAELKGNEWREGERRAHLRGLAMLANQWIEALDRLVLRGNDWRVPPDAKSEYLRRLSGYSAIVQRVLKTNPSSSVEVQKHGNAVRREISGGIILDGVRVQ